MRPRIVASTCAAVTALVLSGLAPASAITPAASPDDGFQPPGTTRLVTRNPDGSQFDGWTRATALSASGRHVAYGTYATNVDPDDTTDFTDFYVLDRATGIHEHVSLGYDGQPADADEETWRPPLQVSISGSGRYVTYETPASNLVRDDDNGAYDVFVHDRVTSETFLASGRPDGGVGNKTSEDPVISGDGTAVVFWSVASDLVPGDDDGTANVFLFDIATRKTTLISRDLDGDPAEGFYPSISDDATRVAYETTPATVGQPGTSTVLVVRDLAAGTTTLVSDAFGGGVPNDSSMLPRISGNGKHLAFISIATDLVRHDVDDGRDPDVFHADLVSGRTKILSGRGRNLDDWNTMHVTIDDRGRSVLFASYNGRLADSAEAGPGGEESFFLRAYRWERRGGVLTRICNRADGGRPHASCMPRAISADGEQMAFSTGDAKIDPPDRNDQVDVFIQRAG